MLTATTRTCALTRARTLAHTHGRVQQVPGMSPTGRWTTIGPLFVVLSATAVKEALEDWERHKADREVNNRLVKVFREGTFQTVRWTAVRCGDIVKILNGQYFPADMVLLSSSEPQAMCYVETANLDGETNLKIRQGLVETSHITSTREVRAFSGTIDCEGKTG
jgi:phospholipid-transporting ATPase